MSSIWISPPMMWPTHRTYNVIVYGDSILTTVTLDPQVVARWISNIEFDHQRRLNQLVIGLDVEWRPNFGHGNQNHVATLQLCVGRRCLLYHIIYSPYVPQALSNFLRNRSYTFVGVGVEADLQKLQNDYGIGGAARWVDLTAVAVEEYGWEWRYRGLKTLASFVMQKPVEKPNHVTLSDWNRIPLTAEQVQYACADAYISFEVGRVLRAYNRNR